MSEVLNKFGKRGTTMAVACVAVIGGTLAMMYAVDKNVKRAEGVASPYRTGQGLTGGSDVKMTSADVAAAVSVPKPGKERLSTSEK